MRVRVAALGVALVVLTVCGNSSGDDDTSTTDPPATSGVSETTIATAGDSSVDYTTNVPVDAPGVTDTEINVAVISAKTNPFNGKYAEIADGMNAYFAKVNADGGIWGRELKISSERDDIVGTQNLEQVQASLAEDNAFATFLATVDLTGADALDEAGMPTFVWQIVSGSANHENIFGNAAALCLGCAVQTLPWLAQQLGATKVGIIGYGVNTSSKLCAQGGRDSFEKFGGAEVVFFDDTIGFAQADLSAQVAQMKDAGVDFVTTCMDLNESVVLAKEMDKQGLDVVQHLPNGYDHALAVSANVELLEGAVVIPQFVAFENEPQIPALEDYLHWMEETGKEPIEVATIGWILAHQFVEGLKLAGPEFSQAKVIEGLNTLTEYSAEGLVQPIDWTEGHADPKEFPDSAPPLECENFTRVRNGRFVPELGTPGRPWVCWERSDDVLEEPVRMSFAPEPDES